MMSVKTIVNSSKNRVYKVISKHLKLYRVIAAVLAFAMIIGLVFFANFLLGYPLYSPFFKLKAKNYIKKNYGEMGYVMESFKDFYGEYYAKAAKPDSPDSCFSVIYYADGFMIDSYEYDVLKLGSVRQRLLKQYREFADNVLQSPLFPYRSTHSTASLAFDKLNYEHESVIPTDILELDGIYDIQKLGEIGGYLHITVYTDELTPEKAAEVLLTTDKLMTQGGVTYYGIDVHLENWTPTELEAYSLYDFRRSDIYEEGLIDRIIQSADNP